MSGEIWKVVAGHPQYEVSNMGRVRKDEKVLEASKDGEGYLRLTVDGIRMRVHTLVAETFLVKRFVVNHIDGNKENNKLSNLEFVSPKTNSRLAGLNGQLKGGKGEKAVIAIKVNTGEKHYFCSQKDAALFIGCDDSEINKTARGKRKTTHGYKIQYLEDYQKDENSDKRWLFEQCRQLSIFDIGGKQWTQEKK